MLQESPLKISVFLSLLLAIGLVRSADAQQPTAAELVLTNGKVYTVDAAQPWAESIDISWGRLLAVGSDQQVAPFIGDETRVVDLKGRFTMPGFIEGHGHFVGLGESQMMLKLNTAKSWGDVVQQVARAAEQAEPGEWIVGRGWHQSKWNQAPQPNVEGYPTRAAIDKVSPDNPVLLPHASGHMSFANGYAMRLAGVDSSTQPPAGGEILKDEQGEVIGVFRETAQGLISQAQQRSIAKQTFQQRQDHLLKAIELAGEECLKHGITSFQDAGSSLQLIRNFRTLADQGNLPLRLYVMVRDSNEAMEARLSRFKMIGYGREFLTCRAIKRSIDGALGPHGAWLLSPYSDLPTSSGLNTASVESVRKTAEIAVNHGFQLCVHAIGDRANREVLDIFEQAFQQQPEHLPRRWRIEHAQHLHPDDIARFASLDVIASMQAVHCTSDAVFVPQRLGMRRSQEGAYVWRSLMDAGAVVTNGTDAPVEAVNPIPSFYAAVTRRLSDTVTFFPEQCMSREEAIRSYTINCAYAAFEESSKGSLVPGKLADIVVLSQDLIHCQDEEILSTQVEMTILGGDIVYQSDETRE